MPQSTSSRLSSPLSGQSSPNSVHSPLQADAPPRQDSPIASGSLSPDQRSQRSGTSSTVLLEERPGEDGDDESALSALSSEEEDAESTQNEPHEEWDKELGQDVLSEKPGNGNDHGRAIASKEGSLELEHSKADAAAEEDEDQSESDSGSLSPPPPSSEVKPRPLPTIDTKPKIDATQHDSDESELESLTDSNAEAEDRPQESNEEQEELLAQQTESGSVSEQVEDEEEDEDGDVTMRAEDRGEGLDGEEIEDKDDGNKPTAEGLGGDQSGTDVKEVEEEGQEMDIEEGATEQEEMDMDEVPASPALSIQPMRPHSSHPPPPTSAAVKALFGLEVKFAALRDRLYIERMEETAAEEEMILNGTHPAVSYLFKNLRARRERLHEVASRRHKQVQEEILKVKDENKEAVWTWWTDERDREQWEEFEQTWAKRRRLIREKSELDHVPIRRPVPKTWADMPKPLDWAAGAVPAPMSALDASNDLALMDIRRQQLSRHASPAIYQPPNPQYPQYYHPDEPYQHPHYAQRVPQPQPAHRPPQPQNPSQNPSQGYGTAVFAQEPRREGRTVPTSSALFDNGNGNGRRSNDQITPHAPLPQAPPPPPASLGADLWGKDSRVPNGGHESNGFGAGTGTGTGRVYRMWNNNSPINRLESSNGNGNIGIDSGNPTNAINVNGNGNTVGNHRAGNGSQIPPSNGQHPKDPSPPTATTTTAAAEDQQPPTATVRSRYPGLTEYLIPTPANQSANQTQQQQPQIQAHGQAQGHKVGTVSPPKSSLGITGIPSGMPFI